MLLASRVLAALRPLLLLAAALPLPLSAQQTAPHAVPAVATPSTDPATPWLYRGSDVPRDPAWRFGELANGVRYAVRRNAVPPDQVSIRVRIGAGSLMERDAERGFAHLLEHLAFRGSAHVPDGESKRIWQRLGATFGTDSNASTTFTQTVYQLDLPAAREQGVDESLRILAGMASEPALTRAAIDAERPVVLAEQRETLVPQARMGEATLRHFFAGQPLAERRPIGTTATLQAATPKALEAFHQRWYRPERTTVIVSGDMDPALVENLIARNFSSWKVPGAPPETPDFGKPRADMPVAATMAEPSLPPVVTLAVLRPWTVFEDTIRFNQERMVDLVASRILNRRLEARARAGASYIAASADLQDVSRSANATFVQILPLGEEWKPALQEVREEIARAMKQPPLQSEIDRELDEIDAAMRNAIATSSVESSASQADDLVQAVDINETVTTAGHSHQMFLDARQSGMFTPETVLASARKIFDGTATRAVVNTQTPDPAAATALTAALSAEVTVVATDRASQQTVSFDALPKLGKPGKVAAQARALNDPPIDRIEFANGVRALIYANNSETGRVYVQVRFGTGLAGLDPNKPSLAWSGPAALVASGVGTLGQDALERMTGNRQIGLSFGMAEDAFSLSARTTAADLPDQLRLMAAKLAAPGWDPNPVLRARAGMLTGFAGFTASPDGVLAHRLDSLLHGGDSRWTAPTRSAIEALTPAAFRAFWEPILASGPIEVQVFGDVGRDAAVAALRTSFGALKPRPAPVGAISPAPYPPHRDAPAILRHEGRDDQAAAVIAWRTGGGSGNVRESRKLEILSALFQDRLIDRLRSQAGVSYSPSVGSSWPMGLPDGGRLVAIGMLPPEKASFFFSLAREIATDLAARPVETDELRRIVAPLGQLILRRSTGNAFWVSVTSGGAGDPQRIDSINTLPEDYALTTPQELQALAAKYLVAQREWTLTVLPEEKPDQPR